MDLRADKFGLYRVATAASASFFSVWYSAAFRRVLIQVLLLALTVILICFFAYNAKRNSEIRSLGMGFDFLWREAGFGIGQSIIPYTPTDDYFKAFIVGTVNTIRVSLVGIFLATIIGFAVGAGAIAANPVVRRICLTYVEIFRNIPLLLQLYLWYALVVTFLPSELDAVSIFSMAFISKAGIVFPRPVMDTNSMALIFACLLSILGFYIVGRLAKRRQPVLSRWLYTLAALSTTIGLFWIFSLDYQHPEFKKFGFVGGISMSAEFATLAFGLSIYTASFISEIVRAGIQAVPKGQLDASKSLGLTSWQTLRLIRVPQALRIIVPPLTSQYLNLVKNSSLAVAIGYADLVSVANTSLTQTARAIECIAIMMSIYLTISLLISIAMNLYNSRIALRGG